MIVRKVMLAVVCAVACGVLGCKAAPANSITSVETAASTDPAVGTWSGSSDSTKLEMSTDNTFELTTQTSHYTGKWTNKGDHYDLIAIGKTPPMNVMLSPDKQTLTLTGDPGHPFDPNAVRIDFRK